MKGLLCKVAILTVGPPDAPNYFYTDIGQSWPTPLLLAHTVVHSTARQQSVLFLAEEKQNRLLNSQERYLHIASFQPVFPRQSSHIQCSNLLLIGEGALHSVQYTAEEKQNKLLPKRDICTLCLSSLLKAVFSYLDIAVLEQKTRGWLCCPIISSYNSTSSSLPKAVSSHLAALQ